MGDREWQLWAGVNGRRYARLIGSSPPVVVTAATQLDLFDAIVATDQRIDERTYWPAVLAARQE